MRENVKNPADGNFLKFDIARQVCITEEMKILVHNQRGKVLGIGKEDEDFTFKTLFYGIEKPEVFFQTNLSPDYEQTPSGKVTIFLIRNMLKVENLMK